MGSTQSQSADMIGKPVVVIIGGGYGGINCAKALEKKMNCVLIDRKDYFFHNIGALRGAAVDGFEKVVCIPYDKLLRTGSVVKGDVDVIHPTHLRVHGHEDDIKFDYLVIATGTSYAFPAKVPFAKSQEVAEMFSELRGHVQKSQNILVVGGGPVGIELVGEIVSVHKDKKVTLVHSGSELISNREDLSLKMRESLLEQLQKAGVEVLLNERLDMSSVKQDQPQANARYLLGPLQAKTVSGKVIDADVLFFCNGSQINSSCYREALGDAVNDRGEIHVNEFFQVDSPTKTWKHIFAIGDCCDADQKMAFAASAQGEAVAQNIINQSKGGAMKRYSKVPSAMLVPIGPKGGASQLPLVGVVGPTMTGMLKGGDLFAKNTWQSLGHKAIPQEFMVQSEPVNEDEKRKNLAAALGCSEEDAEKIQAQMLPSKDYGDASHL